MTTFKPRPKPATTGFTTLPEEGEEYVEITIGIHKDLHAKIVGWAKCDDVTVQSFCTGMVIAGAADREIEELSGG